MLLLLSRTVNTEIKKLSLLAFETYPNRHMFKRSSWLKGVQSLGQREELVIDLWSLNFFVKQDLRRGHKREPYLKVALFTSIDPHTFSCHFR